MFVVISFIAIDKSTNQLVGNVNENRLFVDASLSVFQFLISSFHVENDLSVCRFFHFHFLRPFHVIQRTLSGPDNWQTRSDSFVLGHENKTEKFKIIRVLSIELYLNMIFHQFLVTSEKKKSVCPIASAVNANILSTVRDHLVGGFYPSSISCSYSYRIYAIAFTTDAIFNLKKWNLITNHEMF